MFEVLKGIKGLLFDCYQTLIDISTDEESLSTYESCSNWLRSHGVEITPQDLKNEYKWRCDVELRYVGGLFPEFKVENVFRQICRQHSFNGCDYDEVEKNASRAFRLASLRRFKSIPKSIDLLEMFSNLPMGIISNGQRVYSEGEVKRLNLSSYFRFIIFSSDMGFRKPDYRIFHEGACRLGMKPEEIIFIGDSWDADINPARALGMKAMHVQEAWGVL